MGVMKVWITGPRPRDGHAMLDGETVPINQPFSDGSMAPPSAANCNCTIEVIGSAKRRINYAGIEGQLDPELVERIRTRLNGAMARFGEVIPEDRTLQVILSDTLSEGQLASKTSDSILLNPTYWLDPDALAKIDAEYAKDWASSGVLNFASKDVVDDIIHEFGHIVDNYTLKIGTRPPNVVWEELIKDTDSYLAVIRGTSSYALEDYGEFRAELFLRHMQQSIPEASMPVLRQFLEDIIHLDKIR